MPVDGYCPSCGAAVKAAPSTDPSAVELRRIRLIITAVVVAVFIAGAGFLVYRDQQQAQREKQELIDEFSCAMAREAGNLSRIERFCKE